MALFSYQGNTSISTNDIGNIGMRFIVIALFIMSFSFSTMARAKDVKEIKIGDETYTYGQVIADFLDVAFSEKMWNEDAFYLDGDGYARVLDETFHSMQWGLNSDKGKEGFESKKKYFPWFASHLYLTEGLPRHNAIHKWQGKVTIGLGWPIYNLAHPVLPEEVASMIFNEKKSYGLVEETINDILPAIKKSTGLDVEFFKPQDPREYTENYARIRIIPEKHFSRRVPGFPPKERRLPEDYEKMLWGAVLFESSNWNKMDGYIISGNDNAPDLVICKIKEDQESKIFKMLVNECVVRALGLSGIAQKRNNSLLGKWYEEQSYKEKDEEAVESITFSGLSAFDELALALLYCPSIALAMDKNQVLAAIMSHDSCISKKLKK